MMPMLERRINIEPKKPRKDAMVQPVTSVTNCVRLTTEALHTQSPQRSGPMVVNEEDIVTVEEGVV